ncbi:hypothetical protein VHUM_00273 [Vanrija humicola]|uniref:Uncharacterized protein n=1 Tax=Vanrija humicola TaxID=5417 RepID=A0A7D8V2X0_VANHU|nr:hypothetical protein VHUM_00273 [Vanrija humicola]
MDAQSYIEEQIPLLKSLHAQLALPPTALAEDQARIDAAVRNAIVSVVRSREDEVAVWEARIADGKRVLSALARALGDRGRSVVAAVRRESEQGETPQPLPSQHERIIKQADELELVYEERLAKIEKLCDTLSELSILLGPGFEPPAPLQPVPGSAPLAAAAPRAASRQSLGAAAALAAQTTLLAPTTNTNKRTSGRQASNAAVAEQRNECWLDVSEDVLATMQAALDRALAERDVRLRNLETNFNDLIWYHAELVMPPLGLGQFPEHLLPPREDEETPGAHERYERALDRIMSLNAVPSGEEDGVEIQGMDGIEPEIGLTNWADTLLEIWIAEKDRRDDEIQQLYEKIEPLWTRLDVPKDVIDLFIESNRGSGESTIRAYEEELERVLEIRRTSLSSFVLGVRREIEMLQDSLMMSDDEKGEFGAFIDDEYTEELLKEHEDEAARLRARVEVMGPLLHRVKEWLVLKANEEELEANANDPNRFKKRGKAMLEEAKMRTRVEKLKPKIEAELLKAVPQWEAEHGQLFLAAGERVVDTIENALAAKEAAKEAKKRAKMGMGAAPALPRGATPAPGQRSASVMSTTRKRTAPTPAGAGVKRSRIVSAGSVVSVASTSTTASRLPNGRRAVPATPTPASGFSNMRRFGQPALSARANAPVHAAPDVFNPAPQPQRPRLVGGLPSPDERKARRQSFKPRQSIANGLLANRGLMGVAEVADETEYDDYF